MFSFCLVVVRVCTDTSRDVTGVVVVVNDGDE